MLKILSLAILLSLPGSLLASPYYPQPGYQQGYQPGYQSQPQPQPETPNPGVLLREGISKLLAFLEGGGAREQDKLQGFVERELAPYFDFVNMTQWSLGPQSRYMNMEQKKQAVLHLRSMFLQALVNQLASYEPGRVQYLPPRGRPQSNEIILSVQSYPRNGYPQRLDFYFYRSRDGWKVYDVAANGLKATTVYREYFNQRTPVRYQRR